MQHLFQSYREDHSTSAGHLMGSHLVHSAIIASFLRGRCSIYFSRTAKITQPQVVILWIHFRSIRLSLHLSSSIDAASTSVASGRLFNLRCLILWIHSWSILTGLIFSRHRWSKSVLVAIRPLSSKPILVLVTLLSSSEMAWGVTLAPIEHLISDLQSPDLVHSLCFDQRVHRKDYVSGFLDLFCFHREIRWDKKV